MVRVLVLAGWTISSTHRCRRRSATPPDETARSLHVCAARKRFFHWELEFPDVFRAAGSGFDAMLGNPPWENRSRTPKSSSRTSIRSIRAYGRLVSLPVSGRCLRPDESLEKRWLDYSADFNDFSHWVGHSANPFGDPENDEGNNDSFAMGRGGEGASCSMAQTSGGSRRASRPAPIHFAIR